MVNEVCYGLLCLVPLDQITTPKIFGFSEFLAAVALLAVVYTITDVRYKFRIAVTPGALYLTTFVLFAVIGLQALLTEIWISQDWWVPKTVGLSYAAWQGIFGGLFLSAFFTWMYYAFIRPPVFGRRNGLRFARELYRYILRGNDDELRVVANELSRSARALVQYSRAVGGRRGDEGGRKRKRQKKARTEDYAHDVLLLIANRKFCRLIVSSSPVTAQAFFEEMKNLKKYQIPIGQFASNISSEAIAQEGSFLYEESEGFSSGLLGYLKPVSQAVYGNYELVESLGRSFLSPLNIHYEEVWGWSAKQWEAYCRATLIALEDCLKHGLCNEQSSAINQAISEVENSYRDVYKLDGLTETYDSEIYRCLRVAVKFVKDTIELIDKQEHPPRPLRRVRERTYPKNIYDHLANLIYGMCLAASAIKSPPETCWSIYHNTVWGAFFGISDQTATGKIVRNKVRRLLYDEIVEMDNFPNYKGARVLGYCLNVLGVEAIGNKKGYGREAYALAVAVQSWAKKKYLHLLNQNRDVAEAVLIGRLGFDEAESRLYITYFKGLNKEPPKRYLALDPLPAGQPSE